MTCGIYILISPSGKKYVGQSKNCEKRIKSHAKSKFLIGNAIRKYGLDSFTQTIIETSEEQLDMWERFYIHFHDSLNRGYNLTEGGGGVRGYKQSTNQIENIKALLKGFTHSDQSRLNMSKGAKGKILSEEHKQKISESGKGKHKPHGKDAWNKGLATPDNVKEKQRIKKLGKKQTEETKLKRKQSMQNLQHKGKTWVKDPISNKRIWIERVE